MTLAEAQTDLASIEAAIRSAYGTGGTVNYMINGRSKTVDLKWLTSERAYLQNFIARYSTGGFIASQLRAPE